MARDTPAHRTKSAAYLNFDLLRKMVVKSRWPKIGGQKPKAKSGQTGGGERSRTDGLLRAKQALYPPELRPLNSLCSPEYQKSTR